METALSDPARGARILGLHFVGQRISADDVRIHRPQNDFKVLRIKILFLYKIYFVLLFGFTICLQQSEMITEIFKINGENYVRMPQGQKSTAFCSMCPSI